MPYLLPCDCGHRLPVKKSQAGALLAAQVAGGSLMFQPLQDWANSSGWDPISKSGVKDTTGRRWSLVRGILAATCFIVALAGLGRAGLYGFIGTTTDIRLPLRIG